MAGVVRVASSYSLAFNPVSAKLGGRDDRTMKLLGVAELADGSLNFAFGIVPDGTSSTGNLPETTMAAQSHGSSRQLPLRLPSAFQKKSPISNSARQNEYSKSSVELSTKEAELSGEAAAGKGNRGLDSRLGEVHVDGKDNSHLTKEAGGKQKSTSGRKMQRPTRMKSSFVKQSPVPVQSSKPSTSSDNSGLKADSIKSRAKRSPKNLSHQFSTPESSVTSRGDVAVDVSVQTDRETGAGASSDPPSQSVLELGHTTSASVAAEELGALSIQGLTVSVNSLVAEKARGPELEILAANTEALDSYKLAELKSMAKERGLRGYSKLKKSDLIKLLSQEGR